MFPEVLEAVREVQLPLLAALLLLGAAAKASPRAAGTGVSVLLPERLRRPVTLATCLLEAALAVALLTATGLLGEAARVLTALMFAASVVLLLVARRRDPEAGCGCFGGLSRTPIGWRTLTRAGLLAVGAAAAIGLAPTGWGVASAPTATHGVVLGVQLLVLALLSPELREAADRFTTREPCAVREVSERRVLRRLRGSEVWRTNVKVMLKNDPEETWRHGCWRFLRYDGLRHGRRVDVVYGVRIDGPRRTGVRAVLVDRESGTVIASFGAVTTLDLQGPPRRLPRPREAARRDEAQGRGGARPGTLAKEFPGESGRGLPDEVRASGPVV
ncbi:MauE/DoxX family redox-associated membrane protein [Nocardiopsis sp. L17-MgMaSL7]|uniref:MauE/DoxX family redox-associated membrane protein n=1 Tax=Nocardiopsis sp. L17-MgMaSL7 TaxID=1938893 RepID=UPI000D70BD27|nr:MauE/DoxX family redox-associated membrane protein [Nocardiopsis sp. L17-MgMaSL7]PWV48535.1 methylamine utilization protein MauE [Nocardiopsis sp. L17-MgMaSL7]